MNRHSIAAAVIVLLLLPLSAQALDFDYAKIADSATASPSGGLFGVLDSYPTIDGYNVAFYGQTSSGSTKGIYLGSGGPLTKIVDNNTQIPSGAGYFTDFGSSEAIMGDLTRKRVICVKGGLFVLLGLLSAGLILLENLDLRTFALLSICVWSFCRAYYFAFHVLEKWVDPALRFRGLLHLARAVLTRPSPDAPRRGLD